MLSVLIPVYNFDIRAFAKELSNQSNALEFPVEIICLDDASSQEFVRLNAQVAQYANVVWEMSKKNLGRSAIRNLLAETAQYENLLFLDCDGKCVSDNYLANYIKHWSEYDVIYGGRVYDEVAPDNHDLYFHWYVGSIREALLMETRKKKPYKSFMTNNFMIRKQVYNQVKMDEAITGYGHEDTLFAQELKRAGLTISHIDNPVEHIGIETFDTFLVKSRNGIRNLRHLIDQEKVDSTVKLVKFYKRLKAFGMLGIIGAMVTALEPNIMRSLKGPAPNLLWFDMWKLSKLHAIEK